MNWITVYPQGMDDDPVDHETGWNVPFKKNDNKICMPTTKGPCYDSCNSLSLCYACSWTTCYDDVAFVETLVARLDGELCIDKENMQVAGASNGGMFTYYLQSQRPNLFKTWWMNYGLPLKGYIKTPAALADKNIIVMHGR